MRHRIQALAVGAIIVGLTSAGCSKVGNDSAGEKPDDGAKKAIILDVKGEAVTPAPAVPGAKPGGQITILADGDFEHLDPQQIYVSNALTTGGYLIHRMLTTYKEPSEKGKPLELVGDLATNSGETGDGGLTWKYTLRDGIKFEDGSPITSKEVLYGIARSFGKQGIQGPQFLQEALDPERKYQGPADGNLDVPGVKTPDEKTIEFTFPRPHPELPYILAFPTSTPVQQAKDTKDGYDMDWQATGPYKRKSHKKDEALILERNPHWDPKTDPVRHAYPDIIKYDMTADRDSQTARLRAATGEDATAIMTADVAQTDIPTVQADTEMMQRVISGPTPYAGYININTQKVTDVDVRRALIYAYDKDAAIKLAGGSAVAQPSTTIMAPIVPGFKNYNAYPAGPSGDVEKAKKLLEGKTVDKMTYCFANTPNGQKAAALVKTSFERTGVFQIALNPVDRKDYYTMIGKKDNACHLMSSGWGQDYPDGHSTLGVLLDGSKIVDEGNNNYSYFNEPSINEELKMLLDMPDRDAAAKAYGELDEKIMRDFAPLIPTTYSRTFSLIGPKVGGAFLGTHAEVNLVNIFVKS